MQYDKYRKRLQLEINIELQSDVQAIETWYGQPINKVLQPDIIHAIKKTRERIDTPPVPFEKKKIN